MKAEGGISISAWLGEVEYLERPALEADTSTDVCVIGAGIAGLSAAYLLAREGLEVVVIDDGPVGGGETSRTTAHLSNALDDRYSEIERLHGADGAALAADSHSAAIDRIETIVTEENFDCGFERVDGYLFVPPGESRDILDQELEAAHRAGLREARRVDRAPIADFDTGPCLVFPRQGQFQPMRYLHGLSGAIERRGGRVFTCTHATEVEGGRSARVKTERGAVIGARHVIVATNTPINDRVAIHTKQAPYRSYVIAVEAPAGAVHKALYWDTADPYHYVRLHATKRGDLLIVGGEDHKTGQADDAPERYDRLEAWTRERFRTVGKIRFRWSGQVMEPVDGLAFIGPDPTDDPNVYIATGDSGHGMTHGTIAAILLTDLIAGRPNRWAGLYDPSRKPLRAVAELARENMNVAAQYADWLTPGDTGSAKELVAGSGTVVRRGLHKIAAYRDVKGKLHEFSATCPHLGCIVEWNSSEKTWDCPCHGSRFDAMGAVVNGPANTNLEALPPE